MSNNNDNVTPIRPGAEPLPTRAMPNRETLASRIEEQRERVFQALSIVNVVRHSIETSPDFDERNGPGDPMHTRVLLEAEKVLDEIAAELENVLDCKRPSQPGGEA